MKLFKISRKIHKWLMLFLGVQFVIWTVSGAYMVIFDIDYIHGDSLVVNHQTKIKPSQVNYSLADLLSQHPSATGIELGTYIDLPVYRFKQGDEKYLISASTGKLISPLNENNALIIAKHYYSGDGDVVNIELIKENPPFELSPRALPAWRVDFNDFGSPSLYISAQTGALVTKRHQFWRIFDWMFSFHVMDYKDEDAGNQLLFWFILFALIAATSGFILTYYRFFYRKPIFDNKNRGVK